MALAQWLTEPSYRNYYQKVRQRGEFVILDNGAYEDCRLSDELLFNITARLKPQVLVLPDDMLNWRKSADIGANFCRKFGDALRDLGIARMYILHSDGNLAHSETSYRWGLECCAPDWIGFPRNDSFGFGVNERGSRRPAIVSHLAKQPYWDPTKTLHAMGMVRGDLRELELLRTRGFNSVDSSAPVWRGLHGYHTNDPTWPEYAFEPMCDIHESVDWQLAERNLREVYARCK